MAKVDLRENEYFERFVGPDHVDSNDVQFWYQLLSCSFNFTRVQDPKNVDETLSPFIDLLALNNSQSLNFGSLIRVASDRVSRIKSKGCNSTNPYYVFQSFNALYLIKTIFKNFIENSSEEMLIQACRARVEVAQQAAPKQSTAPKPPQHLQRMSKSQDKSDALSPSSPNDVLYDTSSILSAQPFPEAVEPSPVDSLKLDQKPSDDKSTNVEESQVGSREHNYHVTAKSEVTPGSVMLDQFISMAIEIIVDIPLNESTHLLQIEAINALIVLLSIQMYSNREAGQHYVYKSLMQKKCSIHALVLTKTLLNNFIRQDPTPQEKGSIILDLASGLWNLLTLGYSKEEEIEDSMPYLASQSLLLLNILTNHCTTGRNPYREAIIHCQDLRFDPSDPQSATEISNNDALTTASTSQTILTANNIRIDFGLLFESICEHPQNDQVALILYLLLHKNKIFKPYILTKAAQKLDLLILPLLKILYSSSQKGSHHIYMVLIIFVILSEEALFNQSIHRISAGRISWYKDRIINEISMGSFMTLIVLRSFQYNTFKVKDKFMHTNLFATLGNLSNHVQHLHLYVCQKMVDLLEKLTKRYMMIAKPLEKAHSLSPQSKVAHGVFDLNNPLAKALATDKQSFDIQQDVSAIELNLSNLPSNSDTHQNGFANDGSVAMNITIPDVDQRVINGSSDMTITETRGHEANSFVIQDSELTPGSGNQSGHVNISIGDSKMDLAWIEEIVKMLLEVINNILDSQLTENSDLVYTLLYKRSVFNSLLASNQSFYNMVINIERTLTFLNNKIESYQHQLSVEEIKGLIETSSKDWVSSQTAKNSDNQLLFHYVEDDQPEDFFIPYLWTKIYYSPGISWNPKNIVLFNPDIV